MYSSAMHVFKCSSQLKNAFIIYKGVGAITARGFFRITATRTSTSHRSVEPTLTRPKRASREVCN